MTRKQPFYLSPDQPPAKQKILTEALRLFTVKGYAATTIRDIADATGYTNPALYKHYKSKEDLALDLFITCYAEIMARIDNALTPDRSFDENLRALLTALTNVFEESPEAALYTNDMLAHFWKRVPKKMQKRTQVTQIRELLEQGRKEGTVNKKTNIDLQTVVIIGTVNQSARMLYFKALPGPASKHIAQTHKMLMKALA